MDQSHQEQGYIAYCAGVKLRENPYPDGTREAFDWDFGWSQAWEEYDTADKY